MYTPCGGVCAHIYVRTCVRLCACVHLCAQERLMGLSIHYGLTLTHYTLLSYIRDEMP